MLTRLLKGKPTLDDIQKIDGGYHALVFGLVAYDFFNNPNASTFEYGIDLAVHALHVAAMFTKNNTLNVLAFAGHVVRGENIYDLKEISTIPQLLNRVDLTLNHMIGGIATNVATLYGNTAAKRSEEIKRNGSIQEMQTGTPLRKQR